MWILFMNAVNTTLFEDTTDIADAISQLQPVDSISPDCNIPQKAKYSCKINQLTVGRYSWANMQPKPSHEPHFIVGKSQIPEAQVNNNTAAFNLCLFKESTFTVMCTGEVGKLRLSSPPITFL